MKKLAVVGMVTLLAVAGCEDKPVSELPVTSAGSPPAGPDTLAEQALQGDRPIGKGLAAIEDAARANRYLFVYFYKNEDQRTRELRTVFDTTMLKVADRADSVVINTTDQLEKEIVDKLSVGRAPMPLALALAPNGAVTRGFPMKFDEKQLMEAFASPCMEKCLKALQQRKLTVLCVQNETTKLNDEAMKGVTEFKADIQYGRTAEIVTVDPEDPGEAETLKKLNIDLGTDQAITALLAPPGKLIGMFKGATTKAMLVAAVRKSASGCDPRSGCCPKKKGATGKQASAKKPADRQGVKKNP